MVSPLRRLPFLQAPKKGSKKRLPQHPAPSPRLGVPSLRHPSVGHRLRLASLHLLSMTAAAPQRATRSPRMHASTQPSVTGPVDQNQKQPRRPTGRPDRGPVHTPLWEPACWRWSSTMTQLAWMHAAAAGFSRASSLPQLNVRGTPELADDLNPCRSEPVESSHRRDGRQRWIRTPKTTTPPPTSANARATCAYTPPAADPAPHPPPPAPPPAPA